MKSSGKLASATSAGGADRGVALLVVLLAVTLLTIVVVEFTYSTQIDEHIAMSGRNGLQAHYLARSAINLAKMVLDLDTKLDVASGADSAHDLWAKEVPPFPLGGGTAAFAIEDERGKINLNDVLSGSGSGDLNQRRTLILERLFSILGVEREVLEAILDWLDPDDEPRTAIGGAELPYYLSLDPPLRPRNGALLTFSELLLVRGVSPALLERLSRFVTVLPGLPSQAPRVNVNTAPPEVLFALGGKMMHSPALVSRIVEARRRKAIGSWRELLDIAGDAKAIGEIQQLARFDSDCFTITALGSVAGTAKGVRETVVRKKGGLAGTSFTTLSWRPALATSLTRAQRSDFLAALATLKAGLEASR